MFVRFIVNSLKKNKTTAKKSIIKYNIVTEYGVNHIPLLFYLMKVKVMMIQ